MKKINLLIALVLSVFVFVGCGSHVHEYKETITEPTCTSQGYITYTCTCGDSYKDSYVDEIGHSYGEWKIVKEATTTEEGLKEKECSRCNDKITEVIEKLNHEHNYTSLVTNPTCTEKGYTTHTCSCGESYTDNETEALGHSYSDWVIISNPTEEEQGLMERKCSVCEHIENQIIPTLNHEHKYTSSVTSPTCIEKGYTTHTCKCGESYTDNETEALGHSYSDWVVVKEATEDEEGLKEKECSRCNDKITEVIEKLNHEHNYTSLVINPTCTEKGYTTYTCSCGDSYTDNETKALGHSYSDWVIISNPTEEEQGLMERKCSVCEHIENQIIPTLNHEHKYTSSVTSPTCIEKGYTTHTCKCGDSYKDSYTDMIDHSYEEISKTNATCLEDGLIYYECKYCDKPLLTVIEALDHNYKSVVTNPTCLEQGFTTYTCTRCSHSYTDNYTNTVDHNYINNICEWCGKTKPTSSLDTYEENGYTYINLGRYPQTVVDNEETITALSSITKTNSRGYIEYNGNEYKKVVASTYNDYDYNFINGNTITVGNTYYYLVEPIKWRVLTEDDNSYTLMCEMVLDNTCFYESIDNRTINENTIYPNNYEYSNIRAWLNGYNGSSYNVTDYTNIGFFDIAFTEEEQALIKTTLVDNSAQTTDSSTNEYVCNNTNDKVYLLSYQDMLNSSYGFSTDELKEDIARRGTITDYARSKGCYMSTVGEDFYGNAYWWLRSPNGGNSYFARLVLSWGNVSNGHPVSYYNYGVRPAITITK